MSAILPKAAITGVSGSGVLKKQSRCSLGDGFVPHIVPRDDFSCEESWSEWQDLNLRPPRPERSLLAHLLANYSVRAGRSRMARLTLARKCLIFQTRKYKAHEDKRPNSII